MVPKKPFRSLSNRAFRLNRRSEAIARILHATGKKEGEPHMIEFTGSNTAFRLPGKVQHHRLKAILDRLTWLRACVLSVRFDTCEHRLFADSNVKAVLLGAVPTVDTAAPIAPLSNE